MLTPRATFPPSYRVIAAYAQPVIPVVGTTEEVRMIVTKFLSEKELARRVEPLSADQAWHTLLRWWGSDQRAHVLAEWVHCGLVDHSALVQPVADGAPLILDIWSDLKFGGASTPDWVRMFKATGFVSDGAPAPKEPMTVYRGSRLGSWRRMSWTLDRDCAHGFAARPDDGPGHIFRATVPPRHVLGIYKGRGESEVIVNPYGLHGKVEFLGRPDRAAVARWRSRVAAHNAALLSRGRNRAALSGHPGERV